jgi:L-threonylcarbamoyladenylate synthase
MQSCRVNSKWHLGWAVRVLRAGGIVAHATEGVWGLACDPGCEVAVGRLLRVKRRPVHKGLILIGASADVFSQELAQLSAVERSTVCASWPGAVTWLLPNRQFAYWVTGGREEVAVRVPGHGQARALCRAFGGPLVSTSANISGRPAACSGLTARRSMRTGVDYFLPGEVAFAGGPSEIRTLSGRRLRGAGQ